MFKLRNSSRIWASVFSDVAIKGCFIQLRRANPDEEWENCLRDIIVDTDEKKSRSDT